MRTRAVLPVSDVGPYLLTCLELALAIDPTTTELSSWGYRQNESMHVLIPFMTFSSETGEDFLPTHRFTDMGKLQAGRGDSKTVYWRRLFRPG